MIKPKLEHVHKHPDNQPCDCKEKLVIIKKDLRERHLKRRRTLQAQGVIISRDSTPIISPKSGGVS